VRTELKQGLNIKPNKPLDAEVNKFIDKSWDDFISLLDSSGPAAIVPGMPDNPTLLTPRYGPDGKPLPAKANGAQEEGPTPEEIRLSTEKEKHKEIHKRNAIRPKPQVMQLDHTVTVEPIEQSSVFVAPHFTEDNGQEIESLEALDKKPVRVETAASNATPVSFGDTPVSDDGEIIKEQNGVNYIDAGALAMTEKPPVDTAMKQLIDSLLPDERPAS
jgi:hypothetical protein